MWYLFWPHKLCIQMIKEATRWNNIGLYNINYFNIYIAHEFAWMYAFRYIITMSLLLFNCIYFSMWIGVRECRGGPVHPWTTGVRRLEYSDMVVGDSRGFGCVGVRWCQWYVHIHIYLFIYSHLYSTFSIVQCSNALYRLWDGEIQGHTGQPSVREIDAYIQPLIHIL